ncbi:hypothetical protein TWF481_012066 [Arthrobotrys musiformis]|uniref:F-box domain-containing protein n=1 Tax=Arthrobotrys musiformis TaxID=47236 RepID=A0AAV9VXE9_9PEZI
MDPQKTTTPRSILSFPNEILASIFSTTTLSNTDLNSAQLTCRLFRDNIHPSITAQRHYIFRVDAVSRPTWKLIRHLINYPELNSGAQIVSITVEWSRRTVRDRSTWTANWVWTQDEQAKLRALFRDTCVLTPNTQRNILAGKNSESLLPLLLSFTPNLKSLDLGEIDQYVIDAEHSSFVEGLEALGVHWETSCLVNQRAEEEYFTVQSKYSPTRRTMLFFFENVYQLGSSVLVKDPQRLPVGLRNLKCFRASSNGTLNEWLIPPILAFPSIERIEVFKLAGTSYRAGRIPIYDPVTKLDSTVRYLMLDTSAFSSPLSEHLLYSIANMTANLVWVKIDKKARGPRKGIKQDEEKIARAFLECNKATLHPSEIFIKGGGFNDAGEYDEDAERHRMVQEKQRLFEQARSGGWVLKPRPSPFTALKPLLIPYIIPYLTRADVFNLMLSCKALKDVCHQSIWSTFSFSADENKPPFQSLRGFSLGRLAKTFEIYGTEDIKYLEKLEIGSGIFDPRAPRYGARDNSERVVFAKFWDGFLNGSTPALKLIHLLLGHSSAYPATYSGSDSDTISNPPDESETTPPTPCQEALSMIKQYSSALPPNKISLQVSIYIHEDSHTLFTSCDLTKLTYLNLISPEYQYNDEIPETLDALVNLMSALVPSPPLSTQQKHPLKTLKLRGPKLDLIDIAPEPSPTAEERENIKNKTEILQTLIFGLTGLTEMSVKDYNFDTSFLLLPPPTVTNLSYSGKLRPSAWWEKFSNHHFSGVEYLNLEFQPEHWGFEPLPPLGNIKISSLKYFNADTICKNPPSYPQDLLDLLVGNNPSLSPKCLQTIVETKVDQLNRDISLNISNIVGLCGGELKKMLEGEVEGVTKNLVDKMILERQEGGGTGDIDGEVRNIMDMAVEHTAGEFEREIVGVFAERCREIVRKNLGRDE